jgi:hypothetical protein
MSYIYEMARAIRAETPPDLLPDETDLDALFRLYASLARLYRPRTNRSPR